MKLCHQINLLRQTVNLGEWG